MTSRFNRRPPCFAAVIVSSMLAVLCGLRPASADGAVYKDAERSGHVIGPRLGPSGRGLDGRRPRRLVSGGSGYVGSSWGLGKPSHSGIGTRPDWGDVEP